MFEYLKGSLFVCFFFIELYLIGNTLLPKKSMPKKIVSGYIIYTLFIAIVGTIVQMFKLSWKLFYFYMIGLSLMFIVISLYFFIKRKDYLKFNKEKIKTFIKQYWILFLVIFLLGSLMYFYTYDYWYNGMDDDAYYLVKMATLGKMSDPFNRVYDTGFRTTIPMFDIRNINTHELEASVYIYFLNIKATLFARCFLAFINKALVVFSVYVLAETIISKFNFYVKKNNIQLATFASVLFYFDFNILANMKLGYIRDGWIINTAMHYGSSIVMTMAFMWFFSLFYSKYNLKIKAVLFLVLSIVLMTKSGIALPIIVVSLLAYILCELLKNKKAFIATVIIMLIGSLLIRNHAGLLLKIYVHSDGGLDFVANNFSSIVFLGILVFSLFLSKEISISKNYYYLLFILILFNLDPINNFIELSAQYSFVFDRALGSAMLFVCLFMAICAIYKFMNLEYKVLKAKKLIIASLSVLFLASSLYLKEGSVSGIINEVKLYSKNIYFVPNFEIELSEKLEKMAKDDKDEFYFLAPREINTKKVNTKMHWNGASYDMNIRLVGVIRNFAPNANSVLGFIRMGGQIENTKSSFNGFSAKDGYTYTDFANGLERGKKNILKLLNKYKDIDCLVTFKRNDKILEKANFKYVDVVKSEYTNIYIYKK